MDTTITEYGNKIAAIPVGKTFGVRGQNQFCFVRREGSGFEVWCGWEVPESYDDDYESYSIHPFKPERPRPWVGKTHKTDSADDAATVYLEYKTAVAERRQPKTGTTVGSVVR
jgi:hypothetical protein